MKYLSEFGDPDAARRLLSKIEADTTQPWRIMEVCGGQTHAILRNGIDELLPNEIELIHGPGCPVCVTPLEMIDRALTIAALPDVVFCSFGDMLRVPGSDGDLFAVRAAGGHVRVVYSPLDAVTIAEENPTLEVVFFAVGFETTAPANALAVVEARRRGVANFSLLVSHVRVPPALRSILASPDCRIDGFLAAGHVCTVMGEQEYLGLAQDYDVPIVITGFEPLDVLEGIRRVVAQLEAGTATVENAYARAVKAEGNLVARALIEEVFDETDRAWRGLGTIPESGWRLAATYRDYDAEVRFDVGHVAADEDPACRAGEVLLGRLRPSDCEAFGVACTPGTPLGAPMVSGEGACSAYYRYRGLVVTRREST